MDAFDFYRVPLACEAAAHIGCGIRAKWVLRKWESLGPLIVIGWGSALREACLDDI